MGLGLLLDPVLVLVEADRSVQVDDLVVQVDVLAVQRAHLAVPCAGGRGDPDERAPGGIASRCLFDQLGGFGGRGRLRLVRWTLGVLDTVHWVGGDPIPGDSTF